MRPVNLIPAEQRRGGSSSGSQARASYLVIGVLVIALVAVSAMTMFDKRTSDKQAEVDSLQAQVDTAQAEAASFDSFTSFQQLHDARIETIDSLAKSRFDWERVMRELSIVIPDRVYLTNLTGTVTPDASITGGAGVSARAAIPGPALELTGCAKNQRTVARLIAAMHDIDGVGRVLVSNSTKGTPSQDAAAAPSTDDTGAPAGDGAETTAKGCGARPTYPTFELVAAFDGVAATAAPVTPVAPDSTSTPTSTTAATTTAAPDEATGTSSTGTTTAVPETSTTPTSTATSGGDVAASDGPSTQQAPASPVSRNGSDAAAQAVSGGGR